jgi:glutamate-1-semialdehyde 2,1-aminomutase
VLRRPGAYARLEALGGKLAAGWIEEARRAGVPLTVNRMGSMLTPFFTAGPVTDYASARESNTAQFGRFFRAMLERGVYLPPSQFEAAFLSLAHSNEDIEKAVRASAESFAEARKEG